MKAAAYQRSYYLKNKDRLNVLNREYYHKHKIRLNRVNTARRRAGIIKTDMFTQTRMDAEVEKTT